ncbi:hypothetical protein BD289DRAFT_483778 [Coniella lustricola]|uniref:Uncharacterized protein n=1 Tax=Coniella lustricola TaxID=2025994 RepID=A0A2T3A495_9PEZI|nr:hypothetical protein BD289DRAFT_483778 [Coniella lustricola]
MPVASRKRKAEAEDAPYVAPSKRRATPSTPPRVTRAAFRRCHGGEQALLTPGLPMSPPPRCQRKCKKLRASSVKREPAKVASKNASRLLLLSSSSSSFSPSSSLSSSSSVSTDTKACKVDTAKRRIPVPIKIEKREHPKLSKLDHAQRTSMKKTVHVPYTDSDMSSPCSLEPLILCNASGPAPVAYMGGLGEEDQSASPVHIKIEPDNEQEVGQKQHNKMEKIPVFVPVPSPKPSYTFNDLISPRRIPPRSYSQCLRDEFAGVEFAKWKTSWSFATAIGHDRRSREKAAAAKLAAAAAGNAKINSNATIDPYPVQPLVNSEPDVAETQYVTDIPQFAEPQVVITQPAPVMEFGLAGANSKASEVMEAWLPALMFPDDASAPVPAPTTISAGANGAISPASSSFFFQNDLAVTGMVAQAQIQANRASEYYDACELFLDQPSTGVQVPESKICEPQRHLLYMTMEEVSDEAFSPRFGQALLDAQLQAQAQALADTQAQASNSIDTTFQPQQTQLGKGGEDDIMSRVLDELVQPESPCKKTAAAAAVAAAATRVFNERPIVASPMRIDFEEAEHYRQLSVNAGRTEKERETVESFEAAPLPSNNNMTLREMHEALRLQSNSPPFSLSSKDSPMSFEWPYRGRSTTEVWTADEGLVGEEGDVQMLY